MPDSGADGYLEHGLIADRAELNHIRTLIDETAAALVRVRTEATWPYVVEANEDLQPANSASTDSMIAFALTAAAGTALQSPLAPEPAEDQLGSETEAALDAEGRAARDKLNAIVSDAARRVVDQDAITSETYGDNDPFTLGWLVPVAAAIGVTWSKRDDALKERLRTAWKPPVDGMRDLFTAPPKTKALPHAFPLLRAVHLARSANALLGSAKRRELPPELADEFLAIVHRQLANSQIDDASFDPAELIFALEGLLSSPSGEPSEALIERFFETLGAHQEHSPSWRPLRPFIGTDRGLVLLPLSVEGATALARICRTLDGRNGDGRRFSRHVDLFRKYVQWLEAQRVEITVDGAKLRGWHSEHVREPKTIYTWQTSQVLLFLLIYFQLLQRHVAAQALAAANLSINRNPEPSPTLPDKSESWGQVVRAFLSASEHQHPRVASESRSGVLYGPPGTGKTSLAEWLAAELDWPLITVTPSDFMAQGTAAVEARAKAVFDALSEQRRAVVIFDEIDHLILDRDLPEYREQEGAFKLMTPSMLTKLNDLRKRGEVIFLLATNYAEHIDRAITRPGRIDEHLLILPPNAEERTSFLEKKWRKRKAAKLRKKDAQLNKNEIGALAGAARTTELATFAELSDLVKKSPTIKELRARVRDFVPGTSIESYAARMGIGADSAEPARPPWDEVVGLDALIVAGKRSDRVRQVVESAEKLKATHAKP